MTRTRFRPLAALAPLTVAALLGIAGCGQSADSGKSTPQASAPATEPSVEATENSAPDPKTINPCALVSQQEAEKLAGTPLESATPVLETCTYTGPVTGPTAQVEIFVGDGAKKYLDIERDLGHDLRPLSGIGDEAYTEDEAVFVNKGGQWVSIRLVRLNDPADNRKPLEELARKVADRL